MNSSKVMSPLQLLLTDERKIIHGPSCDVINTALLALFSQRDSWATLSRGSHDFVTAQGSEQEGLSLEYEMGSLDMHYRVKGELLDLNRVLRVFLLYARQDITWFEDFNWEVVSLKDIDHKRAPDHFVTKPKNLDSSI